MKLFILWSLIIAFSLISLVALLWPLIRKQKNGWTILFALMVSIIAISLYFSLGASQKLNQYWVLQHQEKEISQQLTKLKNNPQLVIAQLKARLKANPNSARGWYLLGRVYLSTAQYINAEQAKASFFNHQQQLSPAMKQLLQTIVQQHPQRIDAVNLLAINAYQQQYYQQAIKLWQTVLLQLPAGSQDQQQIIEMIAKAEQLGS